MVGKLFKYEIIHFLRSLLPYYIILPCSALLARLLQIFQSSTDIFNVLLNFSIATFSICVFICLVMTVVTSISRYYKNLFTAEGYLTMTLPVSESAHILVKLLSTILFMIISSLVIILSYGIITAGEFLAEIMKAIFYLFKGLAEVSGVHLIFFIIELVLLMFISGCATILVYYACITIGQLAKKNRVLAAFGVYFGLYLLTQFIVFSFASVIATNPDFISNITSFFENYFTEMGAVHFAFWFFIAVSSLIGAGFFFISKYILKNKLNLE